MQCRAEIEGGVALVRVQGRLDVSSVADFRAALAALLAKRQKLVVLDLSLTDLVDGQALAALVTYYRKLTLELGGKLVISGLNPEIRQFLDRTSLSRVLPITTDSQQALTEVRA